MKNSILLIALASAFISMNSFAADCYSSDIDVVFNNDGLSVPVPQFICIDDLEATIVSRYSGKVETSALVGITERDIESRIDRIKYLENGYEITYTLLADKDAASTCDKEVGYDIRVTAKVSDKGRLLAVKSLSGHTYSTYDNCHDTNPDTTDLKFKIVK